MHRCVLFALAAGISVAAQAEFVASVAVPYNSPGYISEWVRDPQQVVFTLNNHSPAPAPVQLELVLATAADGEVARARSVPFMMVNNNPRAFRTAEVVRWPEIEWNPRWRARYAAAGRVPEGELFVTVRVYDWSTGARGAVLAADSAKTNVNYPDVPQPLSPRENARVSQPVVRFAWQKPDVPQGVALHYHLFVYSAAGDPIAPRLVRETDSTECTVPLVAPLRRGESYVWHVTALGPDGQPATAHDGNSRNVTFSCDPPTERERDRVLTRVRSGATAALKDASSDPALAAIGAVAAKVPTAVPTAMKDLANAVRSGLDSAPSASPAGIESAERGEVFLRWGERTVRTGGGSCDSIAAALTVAAERLQRQTPALAGAAFLTFIGATDGLGGRLGSGLSVEDLVPLLKSLEPAIEAQQSAPGASLARVCVAAAGLIAPAYPPAAAMLRAEGAALELESAAPKKARDAVVRLRTRLDTALHAVAASAPPTGAVATALEDLAAATASVRAQWKSLAGRGAGASPAQLDSIDREIDACARGVEPWCRTWAIPVRIALARAIALEGKKSAGALRGLDARLRDALADAMSGGYHVAEQAAVIDGLLQVAGKGSGVEWYGVGRDYLTRAAAALHDAAIIGDATTALNAAAQSAKGTLRDALSAEFEFCRFFFPGAFGAHAIAIAHAIAAPDAARMIVEDLTTLSSAADAQAPALREIARRLIDGIIVPSWSDAPELATVRTACAGAGRALVVGAPPGGRLVAVDGARLVVAEQIASWPPAALAPMCLWALGESSAPTVAAQGHLLRSIGAGMQRDGRGLRARADFPSDMSLLEECEARRLLRALPENASRGEQ